MQVLPAERVLCRSVEWLTFQAGNYGAALRQANALMRYLLGESCLACLVLGRLFSYRFVRVVYAMLWLISTRFCTHLRSARIDNEYPA